MGISIQKAELLGLFLETLLFGESFFSLRLSAAFYFVAAVLLVKARGGDACLRQPRKTLIVASTSVLCISVIHLLVDLSRAMTAFLGTRNAPDEYYDDLSRPINLVKVAFYVLQSLVCDGFMVWRCYVVYGKSKRIVALAGVMLVLMAVAGIGFVVELSRGGSKFDIFDTSHLWIAIWFTVLVGLNISITGTYSVGVVDAGFPTLTIIFPVAVAHRLVKTSNVSQLHRRGSAVASVLIQSGALNTAGALVLFITYISRSNALFVLLDTSPALVGVVVALIIFQIRFRFGVLSPTSSRAALPPTIITRSASRSRTVNWDRLARSPSRVFSPILKGKEPADIHVGQRYEYDDRGNYPLHVTITEAVESFGDEETGRGREEKDSDLDGCTVSARSGGRDDESMETGAGYGIAK
ncbi:hypothetical protein OF83DRAFT_1286898 [Amylostereum chailletii]|nr:hypothetical protein OF83DRAFT_1286898 [Amylostereum chailletii]